MNHNYQQPKDRDNSALSNCDLQCVNCGLCKCSGGGFEGGKYWEMDVNVIVKIHDNEPSCNEVIMNQVLE